MKAEVLCQCGELVSTMFCPECGSLMDRSPLSELEGYLARSLATAGRRLERARADAEWSPVRRQNVAAAEALVERFNGWIREVQNLRAAAKSR